MSSEPRVFRGVIRSTLWIAVAGLALAACGEGDGVGAFARSCSGERVLECDPHEYTRITAASLTPARIAPLDPAARATVRLELESCEMAPGTAEVQLFARLARPDAGPSDVRVIDLGLSARDEDGDGVIDATLGNPFGREIPGETEITLRFVPVRAGCQGDPLEVSYTTGSRAAP